MARGKASVDASELEKLEWPYDWPPPWRSERLLGHEAAEKTMLAAHESGRLHHAWLMAGPRGIGKATLAWRFARFLLCGQQQGGLFGGGAAVGLDVLAHAPGRLLPTIRSRCRRLAMPPLADDIVVRLLGDHAPEVKEQERSALARLAEGSIGRALELAGAGSLELYSEMVSVLATLPELDMARLHGFAERFARRGEEANAAWRSLNYLFDGWLKGLVRQSALGGEAAPV